MLEEIEILLPEIINQYTTSLSQRIDIKKIVTGVTASMALLKAAQSVNADAIVVHHGYFWRNENPCLVGIKQQRLKFLLENDLNLIAYHLPLDAHPELGNNIQLAQHLGITLENWSGSPAIIACGTLPEPILLSDFCTNITLKLNRVYAKPVS